MCGADVCAGRHGRDIGRNRDEETRRCGARSAGTYPDGNRRIRLDDRLIDLACGVDKATWCAKRQDNKVGTIGIRLLDRLRDELGGDRMYQRVDVSRVNERAVGTASAVTVSFTRIPFWFLRLQKGMGDGAREQEAPTDEG